MHIRNILGKVFMCHAVLGSNHFSIPEDLSRGGCTEHVWFREKGKKDEIHYACGWPARALRIRGEFHEECVTVRSGVCTMSGTAAYLHELQASPTCLGAP